MTNFLFRDTASLRAWMLLRSGNKLDLVDPDPSAWTGRIGCSVHSSSYW
jgi:hypothetical protein